jgi:hypothetical protein
MSEFSISDLGIEVGWRLTRAGYHPAQQRQRQQYSALYISTVLSLLSLNLFSYLAACVILVQNVP